MRARPPRHPAESLADALASVQRAWPTATGRQKGRRGPQFDRYAITGDECGPPLVATTAGVSAHAPRLRGSRIERFTRQGHRAIHPR